MAVGDQTPNSRPSSGRLAQYLLVVVEEWVLLFRSLSGDGVPRA